MDENEIKEMENLKGFVDIFNRYHQSMWNIFDDSKLSYDEKESKIQETYDKVCKVISSIDSEKIYLIRRDFLEAILSLVVYRCNNNKEYQDNLYYICYYWCSEKKLPIVKVFPKLNLADPQIISCFPAPFKSKDDAEYNAAQYGKLWVEYFTGRPFKYVQK